MIWCVYCQEELFVRPRERYFSVDLNEHQNKHRIFTKQFATATRALDIVYFCNFNIVNLMAKTPVQMVDANRRQKLCIYHAYSYPHITTIYDYM